MMYGKISWRLYKPGYCDPQTDIISLIEFILYCLLSTARLTLMSKTFVSVSKLEIFVSDYQDSREIKETLS